MSWLKNSLGFGVRMFTQPIACYTTMSGSSATSILSPQDTSVTAKRFVPDFKRRKMNKHKRRKRFDRDYFQNQKYLAKKKAKSEALFRQRMHTMMDELKAFDPFDHINKTLKLAKQEWSQKVAPTGRKKYPRWNELMSLEELYGLTPDSHIDKKAGRPSEEDDAKIKQLREEYLQKYTRSNATSSTEK